MIKRKLNLPAEGTVCCWLGSLLSLTPFIGLFFLPVALLGVFLVSRSSVSIKAKLIRGFLPLVFPVTLYGWAILTSYLHAYH